MLSLSKPFPGVPSGSRHAFHVPHQHTHTSVAPTSQKLASGGEVVDEPCAMWYVCYPCLEPCGTSGDGLDGFSTPKNPYIDPSHSSVAPTSRKINSEGVAVGGAPGTRGTHVEGHVRHLGMV